jgi:hypothetical protein
MVQFDRSPRPPPELKVIQVTRTTPTPLLTSCALCLNAAAHYEMVEKANIQLMLQDIAYRRGFKHAMALIAVFGAC